MTRWTVALAAAALLGSMASPATAAPPSAAVAAREPAKADSDATATERPDAVSARIQAKAIDKPVEITGDRTERSTTWALPNGSYKVENSAGPVRVQRADGSWVDPDLTLIATKAGIRAKASPRPVTFSNGGNGPLATFTRGGRTVSMDWSGKLPEPTIEGSTATYALSDDEDLVLEATITGFEQSVVLKKRPAADADAPIVELPLTFDGLSAEAPNGAGNVVLRATKADDKDADTSDAVDKTDRVDAGDAVFVIQQPVVFDSTKDAKTDAPKRSQDVDAELVTDTKGEFADADAVVRIPTDKEFLQDPETTYPVTIDPVVASVSSLGDTWVGAGNATANFDTDQHLRMGNWFGDTSTLWKFDDTTFTGAHVTAASLNFYMDYTGSCTASALTAYPNTSNFNATTVTWNTVPGYDASRAVTKNMAHGFSGSCPAAYDSMDVTSIVSAWAFGTIPDYGFQIKAHATDVTQQKSICSMTAWGSAPCNDFWKTPSMSVTYNTYPWPPQSDSVTFKPRVEGTTGRTYTTSLSPTFQARIGNTDGAPVKLQAEVSYDPAYPDGSGVVWTGSGSAVAPLNLATVQVSPPLTSAHYRYRVRGSVATSTGGTDYGPWTSYAAFQTNTSNPVAPTVSCSSYPVNTWSTSAGSTSCTLDTTSVDGSGYFWGLDDPSVPNLQENGTNTGAPQNITINPDAGYHTLYARTRDTALQMSTATTSYTFGVGNGGLITPKNNAQTQKVLALQSQSKSTYTTAKYQYQAGTGGSTWTDVPATNVTPPGSSTPITWPQTGSVTGSLTNFSQLNWDAAATLAAAGKPEGAVQVRVCFNPSGGTCGATSNVRTVVIAKTAFGVTAATDDIGPGTVSLVTGDFAVDDTDASFGGLSIGRTNTNLTPPAANSGPSGVFGAGWSTAAFGPDAGVGMYTLNDTSAAGSVTLSDSTGTKATYIPSGTDYTGIGDAADGSVLTKVSTTWQLKETDGTTTTWALQSGTTYQVSKVEESGTENLTTYTRDGNGRITTIVAPTPTGNASTCTPTNLVRGCRALQITYAATTTATGTAEVNWGNYTGLTSKIEYTAWNPAASAMATTQVANYLYDNTGRLRAEWDPRVSPALKTRYTYDANGRMATVTDPGRATWTMAYDSTGRLSSASRPDPNTSTTATEAVAYGIPLSGTGLPDVTGTTASTWGQSVDQAYSGAAVFPASQVPTAGGGGVYSPSPTDWPYADLTYYDVNGRTVNTAAYGAGAWQIDTTRWDDYGNTIWSLTARNRAQALTPTSGEGGTDPYTASQPSAVTRADLLATISTYTTDGADLKTVLEPAHPAFLASGSYASVRIKTTNTYDQGAPGGAVYHLVTKTTTTTTALDGVATTSDDTVQALTGYDPIDGASTTGNTSGWTHRTPTTTTQVMGSTPNATVDVTRKTRLDSSGRVIESRMPESNGSDAGTTLTYPYTADASSSITGCQNKPEWAGLTCQSGPAAQPAGTTIPTGVTTYDRWDSPLTVVQTSGSSTRTSTNTYDTAGRLVTTAITGSPSGDVGQAVPTVTTTYDTTTGDVSTRTDGTTTITTGFNSLGQVTSYTDADGQAATSTYDIDGNPKTLNDGKGTYTLTYDGTDANGQTERRGLVTSLDVGITGTPTTFTAAYDQDGAMTVQNYPGGLQQQLKYDNTGDERIRTYAKSGTEWLRFDSGVDGAGRTIWQGSPGSFQQFGYDDNDRLTNVADSVWGPCTTRQYTFDRNGNRTNLATGAPGSGGACQTSTTTSTAYSYDTADRSTTSGYSYDKFGRTITVPSAHVTGGSALSLSYFANDIAFGQVQGTQTKLFAIDPAARHRAAIDYTSGSETRRIVNHYNSDDDTPSWISTSTDAGATSTWQRNVTGINGDLAILQNQTGTPQLQLTNPHGDIVATSDATTAATATNAYFEQTEYGAPRATNASNPMRYGWVGAKQRSGDDLAGVVLMGVRLYNPGTGRFLSLDPVTGGTENAYAYPNNPINEFDLSGQFCLFGKSGNGCRGSKIVRNPWVQAGAAIGVCSLTAGIGCAAVVWGATAFNTWTRYREQYHKKVTKRFLAGTAVDVGLSFLPLRRVKSVKVGRHKSGLPRTRMGQKRFVKNAKRRVLTRNVSFGGLSVARSKLFRW